jgi:hypothetical protein
MTQPSKSASVVLVLFGLPFFGFGLVATFAFIGQAQHGKTGAIGAAFIAFFFLLIGLGIILASIFGYGMLKKQAAREQATPDAPWLWRDDWAAKRAESTNKASVRGLWIAAIFANFITIPAFVIAVPQLARKTDPKLLIVAGFEVVGIILIVAAVRASIRRERFGKTWFELESLPFTPGNHLRGSIHLRLNTTVRHGIDLRLACVRRIITGSGKNRTVREALLWEDEANIPAGALRPDVTGTAIPVDFQLPAECYETNTQNADDQVLWILHAKADVPGVDYSDNFELPVFNTSAKPSSAPAPVLSPAQQMATGFSIVPQTSSSTFGFDNPADFTRRPDPTEVAAPQHPRVRISTGWNGTEYYFPAFRNVAQTLGVFVVAAIWWTVVYFLSTKKAPVFFPVVFGIFGLLLVYAVVHLALMSTTIAVGNGAIELRRSILGFVTSTRRFPFAEVAGIVAATGMQPAGGIGSSGVNAQYSIRLRRKNDRDLTLVDSICDRQEARWLVSQMENQAGLKLDTHVESDAPFGPPPQRNTPQPTSSAGSKPALISFVIFAVIAAGMVYGFLSSTRTRPRSKTAMRSRSAQQGSASLRLSDYEAQRVLSHAPQAQAEELLARAIRHDARALELLESKIGSWTGNLRMTDTMKQLEAQSRFSTDLRVRQVNIDVNLAILNYAKLPEQAASLMASAEQDPQARASAVYYLGMLAGRGIAYARIYPVLVNYARNDPDPNVRQWAVEGMRFLGTDEALAELYKSFTSDPSFSVRDRAGCNLSDCGIFTRKQRFRYVPDLISLAANPATNPQMRNWSFMALAEITDANAGPDAGAWREWYQKHGAETQARFEAQEWWRVRGDQ